MRVLRRLYRYLTPYRGWIAVAFVSMFLVAGSYLAIVALARPLFDDVLSPSPVEGEAVAARPPSQARALDYILRRGQPEGERGALINRLDDTLRPIQQWWAANPDSRWRVVLAFFLGVFVVRALAMFFSEYAFEKVGLSTVRDLRNALYESIIQQSNRFFSERSTGEMVSRIVSDADAIQNAVSIRMGDLFQESANLIVLAGFILLVNTELAVIAFIVAPVIVYPIITFGRRLRKTTHKSQERMADIATILEETIKGVRVVKAFCMEPFEVNRFRKATARHLEMNLKARRTQATSSPVMELLAGICLTLLFGYAAVRIRAGAMTQGEFISFVIALAAMYAPIKRLNKVNLAMNTAISAAQRVFQMLDIPNEVVEKPDARTLRDVGEGIRFERVSFAYGDRPVLRDIEFEVRPGEMVAIVGGSGAGKSTLVNLLPRFYDVNQGRVTIGGTDVRDLTLSSLRGMIGFVSQEVVLFNDTVRNNIAYGRSDVALEEIRRAAEMAHAADFIEALPGGYDAQIGESGVLLSGGQRQRLAIARALLKDSPILILDEATSALDTESERLVQDALTNLMEGRTTLVIAHRLSTIRRAHKILVLDAGQIVEVGTHDELLQSSGHYRRLYEMQFLDETPAIGVVS
jgi:ATP-binding cassette, subfamily B, bacterial MsbA